MTGERANLTNMSDVQTMDWIGRNQAIWVEHTIAKETRVNAAVRTMVPIGDRAGWLRSAGDFRIVMETQFQKRIRPPCKRIFPFVIISKVAEIPRCALSRARDDNTRGSSDIRIELGYRVTGQILNKQNMSKQKMIG